MVDFSRQGGWERLAMHLSASELAEVENGQWRVRFVKYDSRTFLFLV